MSDFDYKNYINQRYAANNGGNPLSADTPEYKDKITSIQQASKEKAEKLPQLSRAFQQEQARYDNSIIGRLGLAPSSTGAYLTNLGGRVVQSTGRVAGNVLTAPNAISAGTQALNLDSEDMALYNKMRRGEASDEETAHMFAYDESIGDTRFGRIHDFESTLKNIEDVRSFTDVGEENFYDPQRDRLQRNISDIYSRFEDRQDAEGAGSLAGVPQLVGSSILEFLTNPAASLGLAAENSANIALGIATGGYSLLAELPGEAATQVIEFVDNYRKENNGALPTDAEIKESMKWAVAGASLDAFSDKITGGIAKGSSGAIRAARKAASEAAEQSLAKGAAKLLTNNAFTRPLTAGVKAGASEFPVGFAQGYTEARAQLEDPTGRDMYESGMLEAMGGGGFAGTVQAGAEVARPVIAAKNIVSAVNEGLRGSAESRAAAETRQSPAVGNSIANTPTESLDGEAKTLREQRVATGNVDDVTDTRSESFDPAEATNNLFTKLNSDTTTPEEKAAVVQKIEKLHGDLTSAGTLLWYKSEALTDENFSTEFAELNQEIQTAITESGLDQETFITQNSQDPKVQEFLFKTKVLEEIGAELAEIPEADREAHIAAMAKDAAAQTNSLLEITQDMDTRYGEYLGATNASTSESENRTIDEDVDYLESSIDESQPLASIARDRTSAAQRIAKNIATSPETITAETLTRLQGQISRDTHIPEELKQVIQSNINVYTERQGHLAEASSNPTISQVVNEALNTGKDAVRKGINQYNADFFEALNQGNVQQADTEISGLSTFSVQQRNKANEYEKALNRSKEISSPVYIKRGKGNSWEMLTEPPQDVDSRDSNYMYADANSQGSQVLLDTMAGIATHAENTLESMKSAKKSADLLTPSNTVRTGFDMSNRRAVEEFFRDFSTRDPGLNNLVAEPATATPTTERKTKSSAAEAATAEQSTRSKGARAGAYKIESTGEIVTVPYDNKLSPESSRKVSDSITAFNQKAKEAKSKPLKVEDTISKVNLFTNAKTADGKTFAEVLIETILNSETHKNGKGAFGTPLIKHVREALGVSNMNESIGDNTGDNLINLVENTDKDGLAIPAVARALGVPLPIGKNNKKAQAEYNQWIDKNKGRDPKDIIAEALGEPSETKTQETDTTPPVQEVIHTETPTEVVNEPEPETRTEPKTKAEDKDIAKPVAESEATNQTPQESIEQAELTDAEISQRYDLSEHTYGAVMMPREEIARNGDHHMSPWLMADGEVVGTAGDHISVFKDNERTYSDFMRRTGAIRSSFFHDVTGPYAIFLHTAPDQKLTKQQFQAVQQIHDAQVGEVSIHIGSSEESNPEYRVISIDDLESSFTNLSVPEVTSTPVETVEQEAEALEQRVMESFGSQEAEFLALDSNENMTSEQQARWRELDTLLSDIQDVSAVARGDRVSAQRIEFLKSVISPEHYSEMMALRERASEGPTTQASQSEAQTPQKPATEDTVNVWYGSNENAELSNIAERPFQYEGRDYFSVEHAYQSLKSGSFDQATYDKYKAGNRKIAGREGTKTDGNWNLKLMEDLVLKSFKQNSNAKEALLNTGDAKITHTQDKGVWKEEFPKILESVRETLKESPDATSKPVNVNPKNLTGFRDYDSETADNINIEKSVYDRPLDPELTEEESGLAIRLNNSGASITKQISKAINSVVDLAAKEVNDEKEASTALLNVYGKKNVTTDPDKPYGDTNPIAESTVQRVATPPEDGEKSHNLPLATHKNFLSKAIAGMIDWRSFLPNSDKESNPEYVKRQKQGIEGFTAFAKAFAANLDKVLPHGTTKSNEKSMLPEQWFWHSEIYLHLAELDDANRLNFEENIVTALAYAAYSYVAEYSNEMVYNNSEVINKMMGLPENTRLGRSTAESTSFAEQMKHGIFATTMSQNIGDKAVRALGISATSQTGIDIIPRLAGSLGTIATRALVEMEVYDQKYVSKEEFLGGLALTSLNPKSDLYETTAARAERGVSLIVPRIKQEGKYFELIDSSHAAVTINNSKRSDYVVDKLITGTRPDVFPSFEPIKGVPNKVANSAMEVAKSLAKTLRKKQEKEPHVLNSEMVSVLDEFSEDQDALLKMLGFVHDLDSVHVDRRESVEAANADILRNVGYFQDFRGMVREQEAGENTPFYFKFDPWKNGRAGVFGRINMQGNKFHRYMMYQESWKREIFLEDTETLDTLMFAIAVGFGANPDTTFKADIVADLHNEVVSDQATIDAIDAIQKILGLKEMGNSNRTALLNTISDFVIDKKEGNLSLLALVELGKFEHHFSNPLSTSYESVMVDAVDGVTNGPFIYHVLHGINPGDQTLEGREAFYKRGGMFKETEERNYVSYRSKGEDNYQDFGRDILKRIDDVKDEDTSNAIDSILGIFDPFMVKNPDSPDGIETITSKGRNFVKGITSALTFGASTKKAVNIMAEEFIDATLTRLEKIVNDNEMSKEDKNTEIENFILSLRSLIWKAYHEQDARIKKGNDKPMLADMFHIDSALRDLKTLYDQDNPLDRLNTSLSLNLIAGLKSAYAHTVGDLVSESVDTYFSKMRETQDNLANATNASFYLMNAGIEAVLESAYDRYGIGIRDKTTGARDRELSREEFTEVLQDYGLELPYINSIWSNGYGESASTGIQLVNNKNVRSDNSTANVNVHMAPNSDKWKGAKPGALTNTAKMQAIIPWFTAPKLIAVSATIHSLDSWIIHQTMRVMDMLNNHDEIFGSFEDASKAAREMNRNTLRALTMYSPALEAYNTLENSVLILSSMIDKAKETGNAKEIYALKASVAESIKAIGQGSRNKFGDFDNLSVGEVFSRVVDHTYIDAYHNTRAKLKSLLEYEGGVINQYSNEDGAYDITKDDMDKVQEKLDELEEWNNSENVMTKNTEAVNNILDFVKNVETDGRVYTPTLNRDFSSIQYDKTTDKVTEEDPIGDTYEVGDPETHEGSNTSKFGKLSTEVDPTVNVPLATLLDEEDLNLEKVLNALINDPKIRNYSKKSQQEFKTAAPLLVFLNRLVKDKSLDITGIRVTKLNRTHKPDDVVHFKGKDISKLSFIGLSTNIQNHDNFDISEGKTLPEVGEILIKGEHFEEHGTNVETVVHELAHAITVLFIDRFPNSPEVKLLTDLMEQVKSELNDAESKRFEYDTSNVYEFVVHALSSPHFMNKLLQIPVSEKIRKEHKGMFRSFAATVGNWFMEAITSLITKQSKNPVTNSVYEAVAAAVSNIILAPIAEGNVENNVSTDVLGNVKARNLTPTPRDIIRRLSYGIAAWEMREELNEPNTQRMAVPVLPSVEAELNNLNMREEAPVLRMLSSPFASSQAENASTEHIGTILTTILNPVSSNPVIKTGAYRQLIGLYQEVARTITVEDLLPEGVTKAEATKAEMSEAQAQYNALFDKKDNNFLAKFTTLGLTNKAVGDILSKPRQVNNTAVEGFVPRLTKGFNDVIDVVNGSNLDARDASTLKEQLEILANRLHLVHQKHVNKLEKNNYLENVSNAFDRANNGLVDKSGRFANGIAKAVNEATKGHKNPISKTMNSAAKLINARHLLAKTGGTAEYEGAFLKSLNKILDSRPNREHRQAGFLRNLTNHVVGHNRMLESLLVAGNKIQQTRKSIETDTKVFLNKMFDKEGTYLTDEHKGAITQVFLRAGTHHLLESHGLKNISKLLLNKSYRESEIAKYIKELEGITQNQFISNAQLHMALDFGHRMVNGGNSAFAHSLSNVEGIARLVGIDPKIARVSEEQALAVVPTLEKLVTLFALNETKSKDLKTAREVLNHEITHNQGLGIEQTLLLARGLEAESKQVLFKDDKLGAHMTTAYVPDQLDDRSDFIIAGMDEESKLLAMGYERLENEMSQDPSLTNREVQYMYVLRNGGSQKYVSQALSLTAKHHKGSAVFERNFDKNLSRMKTAREVNIRRMFSTPFDPKVRAGNLERNWAVPLLTQNGNISNYRYEMKHSTKDSLFARNNDFGTLLGKYKASIYDKNASTNHNKEVADALLEDMKKEYPQYAESFIWVGVDSKDPSLAERYSLMPQETRNYLRTEMAKIAPNRMYEADGKTLKNGFLMRKDLVNITLGYRSPSLAEFLETSPENRNLITRAFVGTVEAVYGHVGTKWLGIAPEDAEAFAKRAIHHIRRGDDVVQTMMQEMKQWIVVKSGVVLLANVWSNTFLLVMHGMSIQEALLKQVEGYKLLRDYKDKNQQAHTIHTRLSINPNLPKAEKDRLDNELKVLGFALGNNPVQKLIHAGMMPTIVEDVSIEDDPYSVRNQFFNWVDEKTSGVPKPVKSAAKLMYMSQDTKLFKLLNDTTQYSDFVARYALFDYLTNKTINPLSEEEAMNSAKDSFIVYDIALPRELQYLDNMGLSLFLKYALGIQRVAANLLTTKPLHVAKAVLIDSILDGFGTIMDSAWMFNGFSHNTINSSVLSVPGNIGTIGTVSFAEGLIK